MVQSWIYLFYIIVVMWYSYFMFLCKIFLILSNWCHETVRDWTCNHLQLWFAFLQSVKTSLTINMILILIFLLNILQTRSKITKPMDKWICDYCAMGKFIFNFTVCLCQSINQSIVVPLSIIHISNRDI